MAAKAATAAVTAQTSHQHEQHAPGAGPERGDARRPDAAAAAVTEPAAGVVTESAAGMATMDLDDRAASVAVKRPQRADARRNFDALLVAAREVFAERGAAASLEEVARRAGVGIGTLYRNFPTRQDLFESVYVEEVEALCKSADDLSSLPPWQALRAWLDRFVDYMVTKRALYEALNRDSEMIRNCRPALNAAGRPMLRRAQQAGEARPDIEFDDLLRLVAAVSGVEYIDDAQRARVLDVALDGIRSHAGAPSA